MAAVGCGRVALGPDAAAALSDLLAAIAEFRAFTGPLAPHFAFGALDKGRFARLHAMHLADHLGEVGD